MIKETFCQKFHVPFSFKKSCLFLLLFTFLIILFFGIPLACMILFLKPQMPEFSLQTVKIESYKLNLISQDLIVSSVLSIVFAAENPNKIGLSYDPSRFHVLSEGLVVGLIRIPQFHQPPLSKNVSIQIRLSFRCLYISEIMYIRNSWKNESSKEIFELRMLGDIGAQVRIFQVTTPKIKVALDCEIAIDPSNPSISREIYGMKRIRNHMVSLSPSPGTISKKCSLAVLF